MKQYLKLLFLIISIGTFCKVGRADETTDGKVYKLICDSTRAAAFMSGLTGKAQCAMIELETVKYMRKHDKPCDHTPSGQFLSGFLGSACENTKHLTVRSEEYSAIRTCDNSKQAQLLEGFTGQSRCHTTYKQIEVKPSSNSPTDLSGTQ